MAEVLRGPVLNQDEPIPNFMIRANDHSPISNPLIFSSPETTVALSDDGQLVHNGTFVSGPLAVNAWYTPFLTSDGHLRVRREDGQLEPYMGPDALVEVPVPVEICGREESGVVGSACALPITEHGSPTRHITADGRYWEEPAAQATGTCKAALMIRGEHFPCDWQPTDADGKHDGWGHTNKAAEAVWSN